MGRYVQPDQLKSNALIVEKTSLYNYARQSVLAWFDPDGFAGIGGAGLSNPNSSIFRCLAPGGGGDSVHACEQAFNQCREYAEQLYDKGYQKEAHLLHEGCALTMKTCYFNESETQNNPFITGMTTLFPPNKNENGGGFVDHQKGSPPTYYPPTTDPIGPCLTIRLVHHLNRRLMGNTLIFIATLFLLGYSTCSKEMTVDASHSLPPEEMNQNERELDQSEIAALSCTPEIRRMTSDRAGIIMNSERVSYSDKFGYIYRYDGKTFAGAHFVNRFIVVYWTTDCTTAKMVYYPLFELPDKHR
jgi:hypothetical protein